MKERDQRTEGCDRKPAISLAADQLGPYEEYKFGKIWVKVWVLNSGYDNPQPLSCLDKFQPGLGLRYKSGQIR